MGFISHSLISVAALLGASPLASARSLPQRLNFIPRQATPGFSGCSYPDGWQNCNSADDRSCWVRSPNGTEYNIKTDYEDNAPPGTERTYDLELTEKSISPDGTPKPLAKLINDKYPGEIVEACWGDTLIVNVKNSLPTNGSTIHWHGIRQLGSNEMDGVNGVTQCPIADGDTMQYKFKLTQYGVSWYHSHYSNQYGDGVAAPLLIHGPNSDNWDEELKPILVSDWLHKSAFEEFHKEIAGGPLPQADSILVNGKGRFGNGGSYFTQKFEAGKKYLIRIINGSSSLHFHFSIDNHKMKVIATDFVPIKPYETTSLSVGIGQRYSIIVEATPDSPSADGKYWMRTEYNTTNACNQALTGASITTNIEQSGIISYGDESTDVLPTTTRHDNPVGCADEPYASITPIVPWTVSEPQNNIADNTYEAGLDLTNTNKWHGAFFRWSITDTPLWLDFSNPLINNLDNTTFNPEYAVVDYDYKDGEKMVYMIITAGNLKTNPGPITKIGAHHPIHLHGHDFAIIGQSESAWDPANPNLKLDNPPRRDVAMLPANGYLAIAFKPDNPGAWILHCHIAWHAGSGLALNIMERQSEIKGAIGDLGAVQEGCRNWDSWLASHKDVFDPAKDQEDSGI